MNCWRVTHDVDSFVLAVRNDLPNIDFKSKARLHVCKDKSAQDYRMQLTRDQILQLAPDDASGKAGLQLATTSKWVARHAHALALWGDCQGSGSSPYKTMVDLANMAFKCSCPSRKFPCKHG